MPLYEYECIPCRKNVEDSLKAIKKGVTKKLVSELVKAHDSINHIGVLDLEKEEVIAEHGKRDRDAVDLSYYLNDGTVLVLFNLKKELPFLGAHIRARGREKAQVPALLDQKSRKGGIELRLYERPLDGHAQARPRQSPPVRQEQDVPRRVYRGKGQAQEKPLTGRNRRARCISKLPAFPDKRFTRSQTPEAHYNAK